MALCCLSTISFQRPGVELFVSRSSDATTVVIADGGEIFAKTTALPGHQADVIVSLESVHADFLSIRRSHKISLLVERHEGHGWSADGRLISVGDKVIAVVNSAEDLRPAPVKIDYMIVGGGFKGDITAVTECLMPDSVLLGSDVNARRRTSYIKKLRENSIAFRSLHDGPGLYISL